MTAGPVKFDAHTLATAGEVQTDDGAKWLALVLAEMLRVGLALIAKRYPEARGAMRCAQCGHRH